MTPWHMEAAAGRAPRAIIKPAAHSAERKRVERDTSQRTRGPRICGFPRKCILTKLAVKVCGDAHHHGRCSVVPRAGARSRRGRPRAALAAVRGSRGGGGAVHGARGVHGRPAWARLHGRPDAACRGAGVRRARRACARGATRMWRSRAERCAPRRCGAATRPARWTCDRTRSRCLRRRCGEGLGCFVRRARTARRALPDVPRVPGRSSGR